MNTRLSLTRIVSLLIIVGMSLSQFAVFSSAQAATTATTLNVAPSSLSALPGEGMAVTVTENLNESGANIKPNIFSDILFTLSAGVDLGGLQVAAFNGSVPIGTSLKLNPGQTTFWASSFGGALARQAVRKQNGKTLTYTFKFTPTRAQAGQTIQLSALVAIAKNGQLTTNPARWSGQSNTAAATLQVYALPVITSDNLAGPYTVGATGESFQVSISNPATGKSFTNDLHLHYQIDNDGSTAPALNSLSYQSSTDGVNWTSWTTIAPISTTGQFGLSSGYSLAAGQTLLVKVKISFNNNNQQFFPITLSLQDALGNGLDSLSAVLAVNVKAAALNSNDIIGPYKAGVTQEFSVTAINDPVSGGIYSDAILAFTISPLSAGDISLQYYDGTWKDIPLSGTSIVTGSYGPFTLNRSDHAAVTVKFRVNFAIPGSSYTINVSLKSGPTDIAPAVPYTNVLVSPVSPALDLSDLISNLPFTASTDQVFNVNLSNPSTGGAYTTLRMNCTISGAQSGDIKSFEYSLDGGATWQPINLSYNSLGASGYFAPQNWSIAAPGSISIAFRINYNTPGTYQMDFGFVNTSPSIDLVSGSASADVQPVIPVTGGGFIYLPMVRR